MKRRYLLSALPVAPVGYLATKGGPTDNTASMSHTYSKVLVTDTSIEPATGLELDLDVVTRFEDANPATIDIELTNSGTVARSVQSGPSLPLSPLRGYHHGRDESLFLVPADGTGYDVPMSSEIDEVEIARPSSDERFIPTQPVDGCWQAQKTPLTIYTMARGVTLKPDESIERRYVLLAHPDNEPCLPPGAYEFVDDGQIDDQEVEITLTLEVAEET